MLEQRDLEFLNDFNDNFKHVAYVRDRESEGICEGRPSKGVAIFWRKSLSPFVSPVIVNDSVIGLIVQTRYFKLLLLNVYLPCDMQTMVSFEEYKSSLANLETVIHENNVNQVVLAGDFNADPRKGRFWKLLQDFAESLSLQVITECLSDDMFTYLCPSKNSTSLLDHVVCSVGMKDMINDVTVNYEIALYDHFPLYFILNIILDVSFVNDKEDVIKEFINWNKMTANDKILITNFIDEEIRKLNHDDRGIFMCCDMDCDNTFHKFFLNELFMNIKTILLRSTEKFRFLNDGKFKIIPG